MQLFVEQLTVIDFAYLCPAHGIVGESLICDVTLHGDVDAQGMIMDFGPMKKKLKAAIDQDLDHTLIAARNDAALNIDSSESALALDYTLKSGEEMRHVSPHQAVTILEGEVAVTAEALMRYLERSLMAVVNDTVTRVEITLRHEVIEGAYYHYAHGLKKHEGDCQRIAHGHRSKLRVFKEGTEAPELANEWAEAWKHIYLGTREDIVKQEERDGVAYYHFAYEAPQGRFELTYPASRCDILETESTVEYIAQHIADRIAAKEGGAITARAYEGVQKGAMAQSTSS